MTVANGRMSKAPVFELTNVKKRFRSSMTFRSVSALDGVSVVAQGPSIIGLIGRNGSGKTTVLRHITGLYLPTSGSCETFGVPTDKLTPGEMARIGAVHQRDALLPWMSVRRIVRYISSFYPRWDHDLESSLLKTFELSPGDRVANLSPGNAQRLSLVLAVCHRPDLLILDEPLSDLDPIAREDVITALLERFGSAEMTIVISSHMLRDIERIVDRIVCLDRGRVVADAPLDALQDEYAEWVVRSREGKLPSVFVEQYVLSSTGTPFEARLQVRGAAGRLHEFAERHDADIEVHALNLESLFPLLVGGARFPVDPEAEAGLASSGAGRA
jgi:ABC-type multidrug transport system ATPase subunit